MPGLRVWGQSRGQAHSYHEHSRHPCTRHERIARAETKFFAAGPREATRAGDGNAGTRFGDEPRIETHSSRQSVKRLSFRARKFTRSDHALDRTRHRSEEHTSELQSLAYL